MRTCQIQMHFNFSAHRNICWGSLLLYESGKASLVCHWKCCQVYSNKSAYLGSALSTPWLLKHVLLSDMLCLSPRLPLLSFFSSTSPASWEVRMWVRDGLRMESSTDSGQALHPPHRYSAHILPDVYFHCDFFSPLAPFLCLTCIPSQNVYGWLDNFTGLLTPKGPPEREGLTHCSSAHSVCASSEVLI